MKVLFEVPKLLTLSNRLSFSMCNNIGYLAQKVTLLSLYLFFANRGLTAKHNLRESPCVMTSQSNEVLFEVIRLRTIVSRLSFGMFKNIGYLSAQLTTRQDLGESYWVSLFFWENFSLVVSKAEHYSQKIFTFYEFLFFSSRLVDYVVRVQKFLNIYVVCLYPYLVRFCRKSLVFVVVFSEREKICVLFIFINFVILLIFAILVDLPSTFSLLNRKAIVESLEMIFVIFVIVAEKNINTVNKYQSIIYIEKETVDIYLGYENQQNVNVTLLGWFSLNLVSSLLDCRIKEAEFSFMTSIVVFDVVLEI